MFKFEKLSVWQRAVQFADHIYHASQSFPDEKRFALTTQIRRAVVSISSNIAEGSARSDPDFAGFIGYATGSLYEVVTQATIARNRGYISNDILASLYQEGDEISRMLSGLRNSIE